MTQSGGGSVVTEFVESVRERAQILELAAEMTKLSSGSRPVGLCPFHKEDGPSFTVYPEENRWKCYGCGKGGSVFDLVMEADGLDFWDAALKLASRYAIPVPSVQKKDKEAAAAENEIRAFLAEYVVQSHKLLAKHKEATDYLTERGVTEESAEQYQIGFGAAIRDADLRKKAIAAGLIRVVEGKEYELQMGRLIFPVMHHGKVMQITGRTLRGHKPKYISLGNAGHTPIVPMGIHRLRGRQCVLVEGAFDVILLEQEGIPACATISTNFQKDWLRWCGKGTSFVLAYDADANQAGQAANEKVGSILFEAGHSVEVVDLPVGEDPASYVQKFGGDSIRSLISQAVPYVLYWIRRQPEKPSSRELGQICRRAYELIARLERAVRGPYLAELADRYKLNRSDVRQGLGEYMREHGGRNGKAESGCDPKMSEADQENGLPVIMADSGDLVTTTAQSWDALRKANEPPKYFRQGTAPVRLQRDDKGRLIPMRLSIDLMRYELVRVANWRIQKTGRGGATILAASSPSDRQVRDVLAVDELPLPMLARITEVPVFAPDGTLQTEPGYHPAAQTFYQPAPGVELLDLPETISDEDMQRAIDVFDDLTCDFPWKEPSDRAHAFALWLLPFVRDMIAGPTPLHLIEGPSPGSGKGLLVDVLLTTSVGPHIGSLTQCHDEDEWRKRLTAALCRAQPVIVIDNVCRSLDSGALATALTQLTWQERILGKNENVDVPVRCVWAATANNPTLSTEMARRAIRIRIDPQADRPWLRQQFRHPNLRAYAQENRALLIWAALVICKRWVESGLEPYSGWPLGSFEDWSRVLGGICECAGIEGFMSNLADFYEIADVEGGLWRAFVEVWWDKYEDRQVGVSELFEAAVESELWSFGKGSERSQRTVFGKMLTRQRDRVIGDYRITVAGERRRARQWALMPTKERVDVQIRREAVPIESEGGFQQLSDEEIETVDIVIDDEEQV